MTIAIAAGMATGDFGSAWNMLNTLQLLAFIPMMGTVIPLALDTMLKAFLELDIVPNLFEYFLAEDDMVGPTPYSYAKRFGFDHSVFLMNAGEMISQTVLFFMMLPIACLFKKCKNHKVAGYFYDVIKSFQWSFFLRMLVELFLEVIVAAYL
jgi:hypothetical protein